MALCKFSDNFHMFDITPVENLFIHEFMLKAPGDFVKVYLYGLKQCYHPHTAENTITAFSHALELESGIIENAFNYWDRQGILCYAKNENDQFVVEYFNIKNSLSSKNTNSEKNMYRYKDFNHHLQQIFNTRLLTPQEYLRIYDWLEVLNLPMEVVLMMVQFYINKMGSKLTINYLDKVAESWAINSINTLQKVEDFIENSESFHKDTSAVLKYLGIRRSPSKAEIELYKKWSEQWGYNLSAILVACKETTKIHSPNLGYLDKIIASLHKLDIKLPQDIDRYLSTRELTNDFLKEIYHNLGYKDNVPTPEHNAMYSKWITEYTLDHNVILLACKQCVRKKTTTFDNLDALLKFWMQNGLTSQEDIKMYMSRKKAMDNEIRATLERAGDDRSITPADRKLYKQWTEKLNLSFELILLAAEYSIMAENKLPFMNKILSNWHSNNITTLKEAEEDHNRHIKALELMGSNKGKGIKKELDFNKFPQHTYTEEELEYLFENFETK